MWTWGSFEPRREQAVLAILGFVACSPLDLSSITVSLAIQLPRKATRPAGVLLLPVFFPLAHGFPSHVSGPTPGRPRLAVRKGCAGFSSDVIARRLSQTAGG